MNEVPPFGTNVRVTERRRENRRRAGTLRLITSLALLVLASAGCDAEETLYCPEGSVGQGSPDGEPCERRWSGCGYDREAVLTDQHHPAEHEFVSLRVLCDGDGCSCAAGDQTRRFVDTTGCEALRDDAEGLVRERCGWEVKWLDTMDPEVQLLDDVFEGASYALGAATALTLGGVLGLCWRYRRRRA